MKIDYLNTFRLEDRVLFDGAAAAEIVEAAEAANSPDPNANMNEAEHQAKNEKNADVKNAPIDNRADYEKSDSGAAQTAPAENADVNAQLDAVLNGDLPDVGADCAADVSVTSTENAPSDDGMVDVVVGDSSETISTDRELVVINGSVPDKEAILAELKPNQDVLILDGGSGLDKLHEYLDEHADVKYDAIHFVTHGNDGYFTVNGERVDAEHFDKAEWAEIGEHLTDDGDILLYGCNLAENAEGQALVDRIADASGADVAASVDKTGLHGDWILEYNSGAVETASIAVDDFSCDLTSYTVTSAADSGAGTLREAFGLVSNGDEIVFNIDGTDTIYLNSTLYVSKSITIDGTNAGTGESGIAGDSKITLDGGNSVQIMKIYGSSSLSLTLRNLNFTHGMGTTGGAIQVTSASILIDSCSFSENEGTYNGGAIYFSGGSMTITDSTFTKNSVKGDGGAIYFGGGSATITNSTFTENSVVKRDDYTGDGGAIYFYGDSATVTDSIFTKNTAERDGGAFRCFLSITTVIGSTFTQNTAADGGAGYYSNSSLIVQDSTFIENTTVGGGCGGALASGYNGNLTVTDSDFEKNVASAGGALYSYNGTQTITGSTFTQNTAGNNAGAIYARDNGSLAITDSTFTKNTAGLYGGAVFVMYVDLTIDNVTFTSNSVQSDGGSIAFWDAYEGTYTFTCTNMTIDKSYAGNNGGGIHYKALAELTLGSTVSITNSTAKNNGGGIYFSRESYSPSGTSKLTLTGLTATGNKAGFDELGTAVADKGYGGFLYLAGKANIVMDNVTLSENTANMSGGAAFLGGDGEKTITDSIFTKNTAEARGGALYAGGATVTGSTFTQNSAGFSGGAIFFAKAVSGSTFTQNTARYDGGAIDFGSLKSTLTGSTFTQNSAGRDGGAVVSSWSYLTIDDATFTGNSAQEDGGSIYYIGVLDNNTFLCTNIRIDKSYAGRNGGGIYCKSGSDLTLDSTVSITNSTAKENGGGIYFSDYFGDDRITLTLDGLTATGNKAGFDELGAAVANVGWGGFLYLTKGSLGEDTPKLVMNNVTLSENTANVNGGAVCALSSGAVDVTVSNSTFTKNVANGFYGGAFYLQSTGAGVTLKMDAVAMSENVAPASGGGVYVRGYTASSITVTDVANTGKNVFSKNSASTSSSVERGGGVFCLESDTGNGIVNLDSVTFTENYAAGYGNGVLLLANRIAEINVTASNGVVNRFEDNTSYRSAVLYARSYENTASITVDKSSFLRNKTQDMSGGCIFTMTKSTEGYVTCTNSVFNDNISANGGGVINMSSDSGDSYILLDSVTANNNRANAKAGGMVTATTGSDGRITLTVRNSTLKDNFSVQRGGFAALVTRTGTIDVTVENSTISGNSTSGANGGGAFFLYGYRNTADITLTMTDSTLSGNTATGENGGAVRIFAEQGSAIVQLLNTNVENNKSTIGNGGAFHLEAREGVSFSADNSKFSGNSAAADGGAVNIKANATLGDVQFTLSNTEGTLNSATANGGMLSVQSAHSVTTTVQGDLSAGKTGYTKNSADMGGAFYYAAGADAYNLTFKDTTLADGEAANSGGLIYLNSTGATSAALTVSDAILRDSKATAGNGGAIYSEGTVSDVSIIRSTVSGNSATMGGAIRQNGGTLTVRGDAVTKATVSGNSANGHGGALYLANTALNTSDAVFSGNKAGIDGGTIYFSSGNTVTVGDNVTFSGGSAGQNGGTIYSTQNDFSITLHETDSILNSSANGHGGAIYAKGSNVTVNLLDGFVASGNKAGYDAASGTFNSSGKGGMLYLSDAGASTDVLNLTIDIARLQNNEAGADGGAIYVNLPNGVMNSTIHSEDITGNRAVNGSGGALYLLADNRTTVNLSRSNLLNNTAAKNGGAVYLDGGINFILTDSVIKGNEAGQKGGAIYVKNGFATISKTSITENKAGQDGGAFMVDTAGKLWLEYSTAARNTAASWGGAVRNDGDLTVFNTTLAENKAASGGGIYTSTGADIVDSTIACNVATFGGGIRNTNVIENSLRVLNSLIYSNKKGSLLPASPDSDIDSNAKFLMGYTTYNTNTISASDFNLLAHADNNGIADNTLKVFTLPVGAVATTLPTLVVQNKREVYIPAKWDDKATNKHTRVADRGTMVALKDGAFYYMDATANTDNTIDLDKFYSLDTFTQTTMTQSNLVQGDEVGQNRLKNADGFTMGAYTLPVQSMIVTTTYDIDDPWDDVISLREAFINAREYYAVTGDIPEIGFDIDASYELEDHPGFFNGNGPVVLQLALDQTGTGNFGYTVRKVNLDFAFTLDGTNFNFQTGEIRGGTDASEVTIETGYAFADTVLKIVDTDPLFADKDVTIQDVTITNRNTVPGRAGGVSFDRSAGTLTIDRVSLDRSEGSAALNVISAAQLNMFNTLVTENSGIGVLSAATANLFVNDTIMNNGANGISVTGTTEIYNSIIAGNGAAQIAGTATVASSAVEGGHAGTNNVELEKAGSYQYVVKGLATLATVTANFTGGFGTAAQRYTLASDSYLINRGSNASVVSTYYNEGVMEALDRLGVKNMNPLELSSRIQNGFADMGALESSGKGVFYLNKFAESEITIQYGEIGTYTLLSDVPSATVTISPLLSQYVTNLGGGNLRAIWAMNNPVGGTTAPLAMTSVIDSTYWTAGGPDANYTATLNVTTVKRSLHVTAGPDVVHAYDGTQHKTTYGFDSKTPFAFSDTASSVTVTQGTNVRRDADNNVIAYDGVLKVNSILNSSLTDVTGNYDIHYDTPATLTITPLAVKIATDSATKVYDGTALTEAGYTVTGTFLAGEGFSDVHTTGSRTAAGVSDNTAAYTYNSLTNGANYEITFELGTLTVTKAALTIGFDANDKVYDGTTGAGRDGDFTYTGLISGDDVSLDDSTMSYSFDTKNVGTSKTVTANGYDISLVLGADAGNYDVTFLNTALADVAKANLTIGFDANDKVYDGSTTASRRGDFIYTGLVTGDDLSLDDSTMSYAFDTKNVGTDKIVTATGYSAGNLSGADLGNYDVTFLNTAQADITKRSVTITAGSAEKHYDGTPLTDYTYGISGFGFVTGEGVSNVTFTGSQTNVGSSLNTISGYQFLLGTLAENYDITLIPGTLTVTPALSNGQNCYQDASTQFYCVDGVMPYTRQMPGGSDYLRTNSLQSTGALNYERMTSMVSDGEFSVSDAVEESSDFVSRPLEQDFERLSIRGAFDSEKATGELEFMHQPIKMLRSFLMDDNMPGESLLPDAPEYDIAGLPSVDVPRKSYMFESDIEHMLSEMLVTA